jgi:hypothetical protein
MYFIFFFINVFYILFYKCILYFIILYYMATINPNDKSKFYLEEKRKSKSPEEQLDSLIREICLYDSVHDFDTIFYDKLPKAKNIKGYGDFNPNIFSNLNFSFVNSVINPLNMESDFNLMCQQNNRVSGGNLGVLPAYYTKSSTQDKPNIEKYYLEQVLKVANPTQVDIKYNVDNKTAYKTIVSSLKDYQQFEGNNVSYIPIVIDVQKRLLSIMRNESTDESNGNIKLGYVCNREMTNDAAGKLNFREPIKRKGLNFFVDVDSDGIKYLNTNKIHIGFEHIIYSNLKNTEIKDVTDNSKKPIGVSVSKMSKPWCDITFNNKSFNYQSILNDSTLNSKSNASRIVGKQSREKIKDLIDLQNNANKLQTKISKLLKNSDSFSENYKTKIVKNVIEHMNNNKELSEYMLIIFFLFLRKRIGDQLQALSTLKQRNYALVDVDASTNLVKIFEKQQEKPFVFCSYDIIAIAFAVANGIPCIFEHGDLGGKGKDITIFIPRSETALPMPQNQFGGMSVNTFGNASANMPSSSSNMPSASANMPSANVNDIVIVNNSVVLDEKTRESLRLAKFDFEAFNEILITNPINIVRLLTLYSPSAVVKEDSIKVLSLYNNIDDIEVFPIIINEDNVNTNMVNVLSSNILIQEQLANNNLFIESFDEEGSKTVMRIVHWNNLIIKIELTGKKVSKIFYDNRVGGESLDLNLKGIFDSVFEFDLENSDEIIDLLNSLDTDIDLDIHNNSQGGGSVNISPKEKVMTKETFIKMLVNKIYLESTNMNTNVVMNYLFIKILALYEAKLIFEDELYESHYDTSKFPHIAVNKDIYALVDVLKVNRTINIFEFIRFLITFRDTNEMVNEFLYNLGDITDLVFNTENHKLIEIISRHGTPSTSTSTSKTYNNILMKQIIPIINSDREYKFYYFNDILNNFDIKPFNSNTFTQRKRATDSLSNNRYHKMSLPKKRLNNRQTTKSHRLYNNNSSSVNRPFIGSPFTPITVQGGSRTKKKNILKKIKTNKKLTNKKKKNKKNSKRK